MLSLAKILLLLSATSIWQAISGYTDVFSHRFVFRTFDPLLNPAHVSLYSASLVGFAAIFLALRANRNPANRQVANAGLRIALVGGLAEVLSGVLNETYHQVIINFLTSNALHFAIHGLFVVSMFVVALGGLVASSKLLARNQDGPLMWSSLIFISSIWLLVIGSVSYVTAFAGDAAGYAYLLSGSLVAAAIAVSCLPVIDQLGTIGLASGVFLTVNAVLIYFFTRDLLVIPFPILAALGVELVWRWTRNLGTNGILLTGAATGLLSYWLLYPYSFTFFGSGPLPQAEVVAPMIGAVVTGMLGATSGTAIRGYLARLAPSGSRL